MNYNSLIKLILPTIVHDVTDDDYVTICEIKFDQKYSKSC